VCCVVGGRGLPGFLFASKLEKNLSKSEIGDPKNILKIISARKKVEGKKNP
jgi:hypothetical protein